MPSNNALIPLDYANWLTNLKSRIAGAQQRAALSVNKELIGLYHQIGSEILERQTSQGWGAKVIDRLASDLRAAFPDMKGFSSRNLKYMKFFAQQCPNVLIGQQPAAQLPWFHLVTLRRCRWRNSNPSCGDFSAVRRLETVGFSAARQAHPWLDARSTPLASRLSAFLDHGFPPPALQISARMRPAFRSKCELPPAVSEPR
jgi:hypothetical protein